MPFPVIPAATAAGIVGLGAIALRLRAIAKNKGAATAQLVPVPPPTPLRQPPPPTPTITLSQKVEDVAGKLGVPGTGFPQPPGTRTGTMAELIESLADPIAFQKAHPDISWDTVSVEQLNAARDAFNAQQAAKTSSVSAVPGQRAVVTTKDAAPSGDLIIRRQPGGPQIGGAEKNGIVGIINDVDGTWAEIVWGGGPRLPAVKGFARKAFLKLI